MIAESIFFLVVSLIVLVVSSDKLVESGQRFAKKMGISEFVLGVTIIAIGTTLPELAIGVVSSVKADFALNWGNIVGSVIGNIGLVLGISVLLTKQFDIRQKFFKSDLLALMVFTTLFIAFGSNGIFSALEGFVLVVLLIAYLVWLTTSVEHAPEKALRHEFKTQIHAQLRQEAIHQKLLRKLENHTELVLVLSLAGLWIGANGTVDHSVLLASQFGISQTIIGFTFIAIGTSLPNILVAISALNHHLHDVFLGSIIGANITTLAMVGGISMLITPMIIPFSMGALAYGFALIATTALFVAGWIHPYITKPTAFVFLLIWLAFLATVLQTAGV